MSDNKHFPTDFTDEEIKSILAELIDTKESDKLLTEGQELNIERKIMLCQNQLLLSSLIKSNDKLAEQQSTLTQQQTILINQQNSLSSLFSESEKANKRTAKEAKVIIILTIATLIITSLLDWYHMTEQHKSLERIIDQLNTGLTKASLSNEEKDFDSSTIKIDSTKK